MTVINVFIRCKVLTIEKRQQIKLARAELVTLLCYFALSGSQELARAYRHALNSWSYTTDYQHSTRICL